MPDAESEIEIAACDSCGRMKCVPLSLEAPAVCHYCAAARETGMELKIDKALGFKVARILPSVQGCQRSHPHEGWDICLANAVVTQAEQLASLQNTISDLWRYHNMVEKIRQDFVIAMEPIRTALGD